METARSRKSWTGSEALSQAGRVPVALCIKCFNGVGLVMVGFQLSCYGLTYVLFWVKPPLLGVSNTPVFSRLVQRWV